MNKNDIDYLAFKKTKEKYNKDKNELYDILYNYMDSYLHCSKFETYLLADEVENVLGIREHEDIIKFINEKL